MERIDLERRKELRDDLLKHLESAQAITDELGESLAGCLVEHALDEVRAANWPELDPNIEMFRRGRRP